MSLIRPGIDAQHLIDSATKAVGLGTLGRIEDRAEEMRYYQMNYDQQSRYLATLRKKYQTDKLRNAADDALTRLGYLVKHKDDDTRIVEKYNSSWVQSKSKQLGIKFSESDLLKGVTKIKGECDLRGTTLKDLSTLKKVGGNLYIDSSSALKNLSGIEEVAGSVIVSVKNKADAKSLLQSLGVNLEAIKGQIVPMLKNYI